jgi:hypothetical protein
MQADCPLSFSNLDTESTKRSQESLAETNCAIMSGTQKAGNREIERLVKLKYEN